MRARYRSGAIFIHDAFALRVRRERESAPALRDIKRYIFVRRTDSASTDVPGRRFAQGASESLSS